MRAIVSGRSMPGTSSKVLSSSRCATCGSASACGTVSTQPAGTPILLNTDCHSAQVRVCSDFSSSCVSSRRCALRFSRRAKRGSLARSSRPSACTSASNCSCLLAAMLIRPSWARNAPDGRGGEVVVAVRPRLDVGDQEVGHRPAHRRERRVEHRDVDEGPLAASASRRTSALAMANAAVIPARVSATGKPLRKRRALGGAGHAHHSRQALDDLVVGRRAFHRPLLAEARDRAIDELRIDRLELLVGQAEPGHHAGPEVLDQDVGRSRPDGAARPCLRAPSGSA